jgi:cbb3-type cytochrome oxidase subunit 3
MRALPSIAVIITIAFASCNYFTYTPHSKKQIQQEKPSVFLLNAILDYRAERGVWPESKQAFTGMNKKYADAFNDFRYTYTYFKVMDTDRMIFFFSNHVDDVARYDQTDKVDLNSFGGSVKFYSKGGKFLWKLKMNNLP